VAKYVNLLGDDFATPNPTLPPALLVGGAVKVVGQVAPDLPSWRWSPGPAAGTGDNFSYENFSE
jgi:hypothetical protein